MTRNSRKSPDRSDALVVVQPRDLTVHTLIWMDQVKSDFQGRCTTHSFRSGLPRWIGTTGYRGPVPVRDLDQVAGLDPQIGGVRRSRVTALRAVGLEREFSRGGPSDLLAHHHFWPAPGAE